MDKPLIMVVDDSKLITKFFCLHLEQAGFNVNSACDGYDCLTQLEKIYKGRGVVSCIVTDLIMPNMDGGQLIKEIKRHQDFKNIPIILMSGLNNQYKVKENCADCFLSKPIKPDLLITEVNRLMDSIKNRTH